MRCTICFMAVALAALVAGCKDEPTQVVTGQTVRIQGTLAAGAECATLVTKTGHRYSIGGDLGKFKLGDRVCVKGKFAEVSFCMAGEGTINVEDIGPEGQCP